MSACTLVTAIRHPHPFCAAAQWALCICCCQSRLALASPSAPPPRAFLQAFPSGQGSVALPNGYALLVSPGAFTELVILKGKEPCARIALRKQMEGWLRMPTTWSDADKANNMLYMETQGAHFLPILQDILPMPDSPDSLLAILDWQDQAGSGTPIKAQHLIRIRLGAHPAITLLRDLPMGEEAQYALPPPRLFTDGKRLLLFTGAGYAPNAKSRLQTIAPDGKVIADIATLPGALIPIQLEKQRLLQLKENGDRIAQPFWTYDLRVGQLRHRPERVAIFQEEKPKPPATPLERLQEAIRENDAPKVRALLAQGIPANADALVEACRMRYESNEIVRLLLDKGAPVNGKSRYGKTPLQTAALLVVTPREQGPALHKLAALVEHGADVNAPDQGEPVLASAVMLHLDTIARFLLLHGADPARTGAAKVTPLHVAALVNDSESAQALIRGGANVNAPDIRGETPLLLAVAVNAPQTAQILLDAGADPNAVRTESGFHYTALFTALQANAPDVALLLVKHGADVNKRGPYGGTPLILALNMWDPRFGQNRSEQSGAPSFAAQKDALIEMLLQKGADINAVDDSRGSPLSAALQQLRNGQGRNWFKELLQRGADPNTRFNGGRTVLFQAVDASRRDLEVPLLLLQRGADVNIADAGGRTPLLEAVDGQDFAYASLLLEHGAKPECYDRVHKTPLLWAAYYGQIDLVKQLIAKGANLQAKDDLGQNALALARKGKQAPTVTYLESLGLR